MVTVNEKGTWLVATRAVLSISLEDTKYQAMLNSISKDKAKKTIAAVGLFLVLLDKSSFDPFS